MREVVDITSKYDNTIDTNIKFEEYRQKALDVIKSMINETK